MSSPEETPKKPRHLSAVPGTGKPDDTSAENNSGNTVQDELQKMVDVPIMGHIMRDLFVATFAEIMLSAFREGGSEEEALARVSRTAAMPAMRALASQMHHQKTNGRTLSQVFALQPVFPTMVPYTISAAEMNGGVPEAVEAIGRGYRASFDEKTSRLAKVAVATIASTIAKAGMAVTGVAAYRAIRRRIFKTN